MNKLLIKMMESILDILSKVSQETQKKYTLLMIQSLERISNKPEIL